MQIYGNIAGFSLDSALFGVGNVMTPDQACC